MIHADNIKNPTNFSGGSVNNQTQIVKCAQAYETKVKIINKVNTKLENTPEIEVSISRKLINCQNCSSSIFVLVLGASRVAEFIIHYRCRVCKHVNNVNISEA